MPKHDPDPTNVEFWVPLDGVRTKENDEAEAIALDWLYEVIYHAITKTDLQVAIREGSFDTLDTLLQDNTIVCIAKIFARCLPKTKPRTIDGLYEALQQLTSFRRTEIRNHATKILEEVLRHAQADHLIVYINYSGKLTRMTDERIHFPSLQPKKPIER